MYEKHVWTSGEVITAEKLNDMGVEVIVATVETTGDYPVPTVNKTPAEIAEIIAEKRPYVAYICYAADTELGYTPDAHGAYVNLQFSQNEDNEFVPSIIELISISNLSNETNLYMQKVSCKLPIITTEKICI